MGFAVPLKGLIPVILGDTSSHSFSFPRLSFYTSTPCPFSRGKPHISLQISSRPIKHRVSACLYDSGLDENYSPSGKSPSSKEASFDIKLPRRNTIVQFTCNSCGERTERKISRRAYEGGTVFVQCAGCRVNHKLVDNLGLVVEYDLREELDADFNGTQ